jgi:hypothetical protein
MIPDKKRPKFYRMTCGCVIPKRKYLRGNQLYCDNHGPTRARVKVEAVITVCVKCGKGMILPSRSSRTRYCRYCAIEIQRVNMRHRYLKKRERQKKITSIDTRRRGGVNPHKWWMRPEDYFEARFDQDGFPVSVEQYEYNLERIKRERLVTKYGKRRSPESDLEYIESMGHDISYKSLRN